MVGGKFHALWDNNKRPPEISSNLYVDLKEMELLEPFLLVLYKYNLKEYFIRS